MQSEHEELSWVNRPDPDAPVLAPKFMYKGPDAMRPGAMTGGGTGRAFVFLPNGQIEWSKTVGHESMIDPKSQVFHDMLAVLFTPEDQKSLATRSAYQGEPFFDTDMIRGRMQDKAIFGRIGSVSGRDVLWLWPGTEQFGRLLPLLIDKLTETGQVGNDTLINVGTSSYYTVGEFHKRRQEVQAKLQAASEEGGKILRPGVPTAAEIRTARRKDIDDAAAGRAPFSYAFRYGESDCLPSFQDYLEGRNG